MGENRNSYGTLMREVEGKKPFGNTRHGWEYNFEMYLK
jgi:hypothetical protein